MTERQPPAWLQAGSHPAENDRLLLRALAPFEGVLSATDLQVLQNGTPNMSVNVSAGAAFVTGDESSLQGMYHVLNDATKNLAIAASDPSNPRIDTVIARVRDAFYSGALNTFALEVVTGTPAGSPVAPAVPANALALVDVAVGASVTTITNANITARRQIVPASGTKSQQAAISGAGPTSSTTELQICSMTIAAQPMAYTILCDVTSVWLNSVDNDQFNMRIKVDGTTKGECANRHTGGANTDATYSITRTTAVVIAANTACTVTVTIRRTQGTGTASNSIPGLLSALMLFGG